MRKLHRWDMPVRFFICAGHSIIGETLLSVDFIFPEEREVYDGKAADPVS